MKLVIYEVGCYNGPVFQGMVRKVAHKRFEAYDVDDNPLGVFTSGEKGA